MNKLLVELETRFAFLDDTVVALNDSVAGHEKKIERLERALSVLQAQLRSLGPEAPDPADEQVPPHY